MFILNYSKMYCVLKCKVSLIVWIWQIKKSFKFKYLVQIANNLNFLKWKFAFLQKMENFLLVTAILEHIL